MRVLGVGPGPQVGAGPQSTGSNAVLDDPALNAEGHAWSGSFPSWRRGRRRVVQHLHLRGWLTERGRGVAGLQSGDHRSFDFRAGAPRALRPGRHAHSARGPALAPSQGAWISRAEQGRKGCIHSSSARDGANSAAGFSLREQHQGRFQALGHGRQRGPMVESSGGPCSASFRAAQDAIRARASDFASQSSESIGRVGPSARREYTVCPKDHRQLGAPPPAANRDEAVTRRLLESLW